MRNLLVAVVLEALYRGSFAVWDDDDAAVMFSSHIITVKFKSPKARETFANDRGVMAVTRDLKVPGHYPSLPKNGGSLLQKQGAGWIDPAY